MDRVVLEQFQQANFKENAMVLWSMEDEVINVKKSDITI